MGCGDYVLRPEFRSNRDDKTGQALLEQLGDVATYRQIQYRSRCEHDLTRHSVSYCTRCTHGQTVHKVHIVQFYALYSVHTVRMVQPIGGVHTVHAV